MAKSKILAFAGTLRKEAYNKKLVKTAMEGARAAGAEVSFLDLRDLPMPLYDADFEEAEGLPENAIQFKKLLNEHQGLLLSPGEYNSSIPGVLKNAIDWASRSAPGETPLQSFDGKICALFNASPGYFGGLRSLVHVRAILENIGALVLPEQMTIPKASEAFQENGSLKDPKREAAVRELAAELVKMVNKLQT